MDNNNLRKLSIIILTYNRQEFAIRAMNFWNGKGVKLYVVDGSEKSIDLINLKCFKENIIYKHDFRSYNERLNSILEKINEPYLSVISDDEFLIPSSLASCVEFLEENDDYSSCTGKPILIDYSKRFNKILGYPIYRSFENHDFTHKSPLKRIFNHLNDYLPTIYYGVNRTEIYKNAHKSFMKYKIQIFCQFELQLALMTCFEGKTKILNTLHWLRTNENTPVRGNDPSWDSKYTFDSFWKTRKTEKSIWIKTMADFLKKDKLLNQKDIVNAFEKTLNNYNLNIIDNKKTKKLEPALRLKLKKLIPDFVLEYYHYNKNKINLKKICPKGTLIDKKAIEEININILNFYNRLN